MPPFSGKLLLTLLQENCRLYCLFLRWQPSVFLFGISICKSYYKFKAFHIHYDAQTCHVPSNLTRKSWEIDMFQHAHDMLIAAAGTYQQQPPYKKQTSDTISWAHEGWTRIYSASGRLSCTCFDEPDVSSTIMGWHDFLNTIKCNVLGLDDRWCASLCYNNMHGWRIK